MSVANDWLGIDVGGANLKAAAPDGWCRSVPFPLWKQPGELRDGLLRLIEGAPPAAGWAVTMTGELADCFRTRREGVAAIVRSVEQAARAQSPVTVRYWSLQGTWCDAEAGMREPLSLAASNWHGLATWVARQWPSSRGLLVDIGSTTTDLIPYGTSGVLAAGRTDLERLRRGELVYLGGRRTPLAMLSPEIELNGTPLRVPAELFATTLDLGLISEILTEDPQNLDTANGRPATREESLHRLARQLCADIDEASPALVRRAADEWLREARRILSEAVTCSAPASPSTGETIIPVYDTVVTGGSGAWLVGMVLDAHPLTRSGWRVPLGTVLPAGCSEAACAYALARLAAVD